MPPYEFVYIYDRTGYHSHGGPYNSPVDAIDLLRGDRQLNRIVVIDRVTNRVVATVRRVGDRVQIDQEDEK